MKKIIAAAVVSAVFGTVSANELTFTGKKWEYQGTGGDDVLFPSPYTLGPWAIDGAMGPGNDYASGGWGDDHLRGEEGDDTLLGGRGDDILEGGPGSDALYGGSGNDRLYGGPGNDLMVGGTGADYLEGGGGSDVLIGGRGRDSLYGRRGADIIIGGPGKDKLFVKEESWGAEGDLYILDSPASEDVFYSHPESMDETYGERGYYYGTLAEMRYTHDEITEMAVNDGLTDIHNEGSATARPNSVMRIPVEEANVPSIGLGALGTFTLDRSALRPFGWQVMYTHHGRLGWFHIAFPKK